MGSLLGKLQYKVHLWWEHGNENTRQRIFRLENDRIKKDLIINGLFFLRAVDRMEKHCADIKDEAFTRERLSFYDQMSRDIRLRSDEWSNTPARAELASKLKTLMTECQ